MAAQSWPTPASPLHPPPQAPLLTLGLSSSPTRWHQLRKLATGAGVFVAARRPGHLRQASAVGAAPPGSSMGAEKTGARARSEGPGLGRGREERRVTRGTAQSARARRAESGVAR